MADKPIDERLRNELVDYVDELADRDFPAQHWRTSRTHPAPGAAWPYHIDYFVYDNPFTTAPEYNVGLRLRNGQEAKVIGDLAVAIEAIAKKVGYYAEPAMVLSHPDWPNIVHLARKARKALSA